MTDKQSNPQKSKRQAQRKASESNQEKNARASDAKKKTLVAILIPLLGLAIWTQPKSQNEIGSIMPSGGQTVPSLQPIAAKSTNRGPIPQALKNAAPSDLSRFDIRELPRIQLSDVINVEAFRNQSIEDPDKIAELNLVTKVKAIYGSQRGRSALLGSRVVKDGQNLGQQGRMIRVTKSGVELVQ